MAIDLPACVDLPVFVNPLVHWDITQFFFFFKKTVLMKVGVRPLVPNFYFKEVAERQSIFNFT